jgi:hypothetical protein
MERSFYNEDFDLEQLIKQKSDQYKIYPSDKVWKGIHGSLHSTRKWYWFSFILFLAGVSYFTIEQLASPVRKLAGTKSNTPSSTTINNNDAIILPFTPPTAGYIKEKIPSDYRRKGLVVAMHEIAVASAPPIETTASPSPLDRQTGLDAEAGHLSQPERSLSLELTDRDLDQSEILEKYNRDIESIYANKKGNVVSELASEKVNDLDENLVASNHELSDQKRINWLQENAVYELTKPKLKRTSWQVTASPTMNYRKLTGDKNASVASDAKNIPIALNIAGDVENLVNHKPALGFEVASMFLYAVNKTLVFKTGLPQ